MAASDRNSFSKVTKFDICVFFSYCIILLFSFINIQLIINVSFRFGFLNCLRFFALVSRWLSFDTDRNDLSPIKFKLLILFFTNRSERFSDLSISMESTVWLRFFCVCMDVTIRFSRSLGVHV